jgi:hypothetical protein
LPTKITCVPMIQEDVHFKFPSGKPELQIFEYGGRVTITTKGTSKHWAYGAKGVDFFQLKEKEKVDYTNVPVSVRRSMYLISLLAPVEY